jgi:RNA polymerase sigma-70 factor, ECF subfamily
LHSDSPLVDRAIAAGRAGDRSALHYLYVRYADEVCAHLSDIVGRRGDRDEITQNVFLAMSRAIATYDPKDLPVDCWLLSLADDYILNHAA